MRYLARFIFLIPLSFFLLVGKGQAINVKEIIADHSPVFINKHVQYVTSTSLLDIDSIRRIPDSVYSFLKNKDLIFQGYDPYYYSFRLVLENSDTMDHELILLPGGLGIRTASLWQGKKDSWRLIGQAGYRFPFHSRSYPFIHHAFRIKITANTIDTIYLSKDETHAYKTFAFVLATPKVLQKAEHKTYGFFGFLTGILLLFALLNLYLYFSLHEKIHLWYSLYIICMGVFLIKHDGLDAEFLGMDSELAYRLTPMGGFAVVAMGILAQVTQLFLKPVLSGTFLNKLLTVLKWSAWLSGLGNFITFYLQPDYRIEKIMVQWANMSIMATIFLTIVSAGYSLVKGFRPSLFILLGMSVFLAGGITRVLFISTKNIIFPPTLFQVGLLTEAIIISFGLMYRYNRYKKDKEDLKLKLEHQQLEAGKQVLKTQEVEQRRIARDLHDELGGNLAAIKMTLQSFNLPEEQAGLLVSLVDKASVNARNIAHNLMPPQFEETPLLIILDNHFRNMNADGHTRFHFIYTGKAFGFDKQDELMIYRIIMELSSNIRKHARATEATVQLIYHEHKLELMIEDNGQGINKDSVEGMGLSNIRSRIQYLSGSLTIDTGSKGTTIIISLPYKK